MKIEIIIENEIEIKIETKDESKFMKNGIDFLFSFSFLTPVFQIYIQDDKKSSNHSSPIVYQHV